MALWLSSLTVLQRIWFESQHPHMTHNCLQLQFQGISYPLLASKGTRHIGGTETYMQAKKIMHIK